MGIVLLQFHHVYIDLIHSNWYLMPLNEKKAFVLLLNAAKKTEYMHVADVAPLNVNTFKLVRLGEELRIIYSDIPINYAILQVVQRIFSMVMVLRRTM